MAEFVPELTSSSTSTTKSLWTHLGTDQINRPCKQTILPKSHNSILSSSYYTTFKTFYGDLIHQGKEE